MTRLPSILLAGCLGLFTAWPPASVAFAADEAPKPAHADDRADDATVEALVQRAKACVVVITQTGRDGNEVGVGSGFIISPDGLIATNLHVIGQARPISVQLTDGKRYAVTSVHASDRTLDLAVIRIDAKNLPALVLGDSDSLKQGQAVIAIGNPLGLRLSVVKGVVSAIRELDNRAMIQLAMPIEPGNSGGPVIDMQGRVHGLVTLKSAITRNLGFAVPINALKPLLEKPNPIPMSRWLTIGALDPQQWRTLFGASWRQHAGRIHVTGMGKGFGGRSLCLWQSDPPKRPFEVAVTVKLDDEAGAAGLAFYSDGDQKHYGFYPSAGRLRLSRFDGPDVFTWRVLEDVASPHYAPGDWNTLKVRLEEGKILCYVNDHLVIESTDAVYTSGKVGLAKFRDTEAHFRNFRIAESIPSTRPSDETIKRITEQVRDLPATGQLPADLIAALAPDDAASRAVLTERAKLLEEQAEQLRKLALAVHLKHAQDELAALMHQDEDKIDLFHAAMLIARMDNHEVDVDAYRQELARMTEQLRKKLPEKADDEAKLAALNAYLFEESGFHGSRGDYYNRSNSYMNEVIDDREGLPITLCVLYIELARRIGLNVKGAPLPGHFVAQYIPAKGQPRLIDVYDGGRTLSRQDAAKRVEEITGQPLQDQDLAPASKKAIVTRMLRNLMGVARQADATDGPLRYLDTVLAIDPDAGQERWVRAVLRFQSGQHDAALADTQWLLDHQPPQVDMDRVHQLRQAIESARR